MATPSSRSGAENTSGQDPLGEASAEKRTASGVRASEWLVNVQGDRVVPMTSAQLVEAMRAGTLPDSSLVWRIGMHDWSKLGDVPQLRLALGSQTPAPSRTKSAFAPLAPLAAQAESRRRLDTLPFGFPVVRPPAATAAPGPRLMPPPKPVERKAHVAALEAEPVQSRISHSLIPTSSDANRAPSSALPARISTPSLSNHEIRPRPFKRVALWAACGVIGASSLVAIWTLKSSQPEPAKRAHDDRASAVTTPAVATAALAPPLPAALNAPGSSAQAATAPAKPASSAARLPARRAPTRPARRAKPIPAPAADAPSEASSAHEESPPPSTAASSTSAQPPEPVDAAPSAAMPKPEPPPPATLDPLVPSNF